MSTYRIVQRVTLPSLIIFSFTLLVLPAPLAAQDSNAQPVEEITVTARKRAETLQDVPATVTVFPEERIERSNINRAGEIALLTPGVSMVDAAEVGDTQVNIRGMNGARDAENSYALVIDGVHFVSSGGQSAPEGGGGEGYTPVKEVLIVDSTPTKHKGASYASSKGAVETPFVRHLK